jgi:hypothetical protein
MGMGSEHPQQSPALAVEFDFYDQEFQNDPHNKYLEMLDKLPFHREPDLGWHAVFRHADIMDIVRNNEQFSVRHGPGTTYAEAGDIFAEQPDAVIIATGSAPRMDGVQNSNPGEPIEGHQLPHVLSSHDVLAANRRWEGARVTVLDNTGHYEALGIAEHLVTDGAHVTFVSRPSSNSAIRSRTR